MEDQELYTLEDYFKPSGLEIGDKMRSKIDGAEFIIETKEQLFNLENDNLGEWWLLFDKI